MNFRVIATLAVLLSGSAFAQGGGPPMMTDDPGTVAWHKLEINTSIIGHRKNLIELEAPLIDVNYGFRDGIQLKIEMPYLVSETKNNKVSGKPGNPSVGCKYRFVEQEQTGLSVSMYPAVQVPVAKNDLPEWTLPFQVEKVFDDFLVGQEIGMIHTSDHSWSMLSGTLVGHKFSEEVEVMAEMLFRSNFRTRRSAEAFLNAGMRYCINEQLVCIACCGTQWRTPEGEERETVLSCIGLQITL